MPKLELVVATTNEKKKKELLAMLKGLDIKVLTLNDFQGPPAVREDKDTFRGNAVKKALVTSRFTKRLTLAEDSGLEVAALGGAPGVRSARFAGPSKSDPANIRKLLKMLKGLPISRRKARFVCFAAIADSGRLVRTAVGTVSGLISMEERGQNGFGYDPVFYYPPLKKNFAELGPEAKNRVSHRYRALRKVRKYLQDEMVKGALRKQTAYG